MIQWHRKRAEQSREKTGAEDPFVSIRKLNNPVSIGAYEWALSGNFALRIKQLVKKNLINILLANEQTDKGTSRTVRELFERDLSQLIDHL